MVEAREIRGHYWASLSRVLGACFWLTKPNIIVLLLITTLAAMIAAGGVSVSWSLVLATLGGGFLCAGGANVLNSYLDWDIDRLMRRTQKRPLPSGRLSRRSALILGTVLAALSLSIFVLFVNVVSAVLAGVALAYYVLVYSLYLKRRTPQNVVIGGAAGAFPPMIGWTAVAGSIEPAAVFLFLIIFFWTPPHTWALALLVKEDYSQARIPMLPVVLGERETLHQILLYSLALVALTLVPAALRLFGLVYLVTALVLGVLFVALAAVLYLRPTPRHARNMFRFSNLYLALFFLGLVIDRVLL